MIESLTTHHSPATPAIAFVIGTRPEAIKLAPVLRQVSLRRDLQSVIISSGQQRDLIGPALAAFDLVPDYDLDLMQPGQSLADLTAACMKGLAQKFAELKPSLVFVQGDTATALAGAMAGFFNQIPVAHVEAGLRTHDQAAPFPEEANRQMISRLATLHFAPTVDAKAHLLAEGIDPAAIEVTGNSVVDALRILTPRIDRIPASVRIPSDRRLVLVTAHRRENLGRPLDNICTAIQRLSRRPELHFVFVTHPNPAAARTARERLAGRPNITLVPPLPYLEMLRLVSDSWLILTDSGGLQEEAPSFRRPVLVLREQTERIEGLTSGAARLVGTRPKRIMEQVTRLLESPIEYEELTPSENPYGDGHASQRIVRTISRFIKRTIDTHEWTGHAA